ncbi:MAG TPA: polymer-forming cytoskeletal protein [Flavobacteriaceae bacterium]|nr:polymer-forming cytoskeletal protein [Flavobacteriaceae bacterium]
MFSETKKNRINEHDRTKEQNKIAQGTKIVGDIVAKGCFRIEGTLEGTLKTPNKIVVGKTGFIDGKIECESADFEGKFSGDLIVSETLTLRSTALIEGEVSTGKLAIEPGATFNASCIMKGSGLKSIKDGKQQEREEKTQKEKSA